MPWNPKIWVLCSFCTFLLQKSRSIYRHAFLSLRRPSLKFKSIYRVRVLGGSDRFSYFYDHCWYLQNVARYSFFYACLTRSKIRNFLEDGFFRVFRAFFTLDDQFSYFGRKSWYSQYFWNKLNWIELIFIKIKNITSQYIDK